MKSSIMVAAVLLGVSPLCSMAAGDPNEKQPTDRSSTEAGVNGGKNTSQVRKDANTGGTIKDNKGNTRDYKTGKVINK